MPGTGASSVPGVTSGVRSALISRCRHWAAASSCRCSTARPRRLADRTAAAAPVDRHPRIPETDHDVSRSLWPTQHGSIGGTRRRDPAEVKGRETPLMWNTAGPVAGTSSRSSSSSCRHRGGGTSLGPVPGREVLQSSTDKTCWRSASVMALSGVGRSRVGRPPRTPALVPCGSRRAQQCARRGSTLLLRDRRTARRSRLRSRSGFPRLGEQLQEAGP